MPFVLAYVFSLNEFHKWRDISDFAFFVVFLFV